MPANGSATLVLAMCAVDVSWKGKEGEVEEDMESRPTQLKMPASQTFL